MVPREGPVVVEFNGGLGDPETEAIVPALDVDWYEFWISVSHGELAHLPPVRRSAVAVVMASSGYPASPKTGMDIRLGDRQDHTVVFHAGTALDDGRLVSRGGRVLAVVGTADTLSLARDRAYNRLTAIDFPDSWFRPDIGADSP